jgi:RHS repeat-associated protein
LIVRRSVIVVCALAALLGAGTAHAQGSGYFRHYVVALDELATATDDPASVAADLAHAYGGRLEIYAAEGFRGFAIAISDEKAKLLAADPRVKSVREYGGSKAGNERPVTVAAQPPAALVAAPNGTPLPPIQVGPYKYDAAGNIVHVGSDRYTYDAMSRIVSGTAVTAQNADTQQFGYDGFGNLATVTIPGKSTLYIDVDSSNNKLKSSPGTQSGTNVTHTWAGGTNGGYDALGNQTAVNGGAYVYAYDSLGTLSDMTSPRREMYIYDGDEQRVATVSYTNATNAVWRYTIRDTNAKVLRELTDTIVNGAHAWAYQKDYVYRNGSLLAAVAPLSGGSDSRTHFHLDHLGSAVLITDENGERISSHKYWPFGADAPGSDSDGERMKFTGHERDLAGSDVNALDYFGSRYYRSISGRFMSADPILGRVNRTQSWNRYAYVRNNPLSLVDPNGKYDIYCVPAAIDCDRDKEEFKLALAHALTDPDEKTRQAAAAYGTENDGNGVHVKIGPTSQAHADGETKVSVGFDDEKKWFKGEVTIPIGFAQVDSGHFHGVRLEAAIAHEGSHVKDGKTFFEALSWAPFTWDLAKNLTQYQTEVNGYQVTAAVYSRAGQSWTPCHGCKIGAGVNPHDRDTAINNILADPAMGYNLTPARQGSHQINDPPYNAPPTP